MKQLKVYVNEKGEPISRQRDEQIRHPDRHNARQRLHHAILVGDFPPAATQRCTDCGDGAHEYDHWLGYAPKHALAVQPVCRRCHVRRERLRRTECDRGHSYAEFGGFRKDGDRYCLECSKLRQGRMPKDIAHAGHRKTPGRNRENTVQQGSRLTEEEARMLVELVRAGFALGKTTAIARAIREAHERFVKAAS